MLRQRVLTSVLLIPPVLAVILFAPTWLFDLVVAVALALLAWEFAGLCGLGPVGRGMFLSAAVLLFAAAVWPWPHARRAGEVLVAVATALWLLTPLWLATRASLPAALKALLGLLLLAGAGAALHALKLLGANGLWILMAFLVVWAADVGGYAAGRTWGRHKLAPAISPGKTWEGFAGGVALVLLIGAPAMVLLDDELRVPWAALLLLLAVISVVGDLFESLLKRQAGVKDSGSLLPGHGGLLDRLDSLLAVAPVFLLAGSEIGIFGELSFFGS